MLFGLYAQTSAVALVAAIPVAAWELCLAVRLIVTGLAPTAEPAREPALPVPVPA
ncbi:hypothetical protein JKP75_18630 [Blastococcus sp. TML/M2B]|uniref:hypothetical protein n=1 Tax=unclassified Blastococcus TaxID=2619396 RepID=UPI00190A4585|nr:MULTISPECIES: hypothetical protein [unclassified Blastococcus]MBN1094380.1 hypothetical protein [Blastococcus sp. TML/M2B]MBN1095341.1 hypothetical protein [Blastococcus sp. TML/C7B]